MILYPGQPSPHTEPPKRIVSLVPSLTELLADLALVDEVIGITKFCEHPASWRKEKTLIGGTKNANVDLIKSLQADLIIANKEENIKETVEQLATEISVAVTDISTVDEALEQIDWIGQLTFKSRESEDLIKRISNGFENITKIPNRPSVVYLIWNDPVMSIGGDTFISDVLTFLGLKNAFSESIRYPESSIEQIVDIQPDYLFLSSEPFPFSEKHLNEWAAALPKTRVLLVDGSMFSWYGSRMRLLPDYWNRELSKSIQLQS